MKLISPKERGNSNTLLHLRKIAWMCVSLQFTSAIAFLFSFSILTPTNSIAVTCGVIAILIALVPVFYALYTKHFLVLFSCLTAFNLAPVWFLYKDCVLPGTETFIYSPAHLKVEAFFYVAIFQLFVNLLYFISWRRGVLYSIKIFSFLNELKLSTAFFINFSIVAFVFPIVAFYFYYGSFDVLWLAITGGRSGGGSQGGLLIQDSLGGSNSLMIPVNSFWQLTPLFGSMAFASARRKQKFFPVLSLLLGMVVIFAFFLGGSRGTMMFVAAPVLFFLLYYNWHKGLKFWIPVAVLFFLCVGVMELQVRFRGNLLNVIADPTKAARIEGLSSATTLDPTKAQQENNMYLLCLILKGHPNKYPFEGFNDFFATLVNPIPRAFWPGKPILNGARELSYQPKYILDGPLFMGTTSLTFSVVGEAYLAKGFIGIVFYSFVYALFISLFEGIIIYTRQKNVISIGLLGVSVFLAFWGYRSFFALVTFIYPLIIFISMLRIVKFFKK